MLRKHPIAIISPPEDAPFYRSFPMPGEELLVLQFGQALCSVISREIDLFLIDCGFEPWFGLQLLEDLKERFPGIPILFVTAQSSEEIVMRAFKGGARDYFHKPLQVFGLRDVVTELLRVKRATREPRGALSASENGLPQNGNLCNIGLLEPAVMKVVCYVESNFKEAIRLDQMAGLAHMSKHHFVRLFKHQVGMSPVRYLKFVRIQRAKEYLKRKDLTVFAIALRVGFQDVSNFNKNFKNIEGVTPSQYRTGLTAARLVPALAKPVR